MRLFWKFFLLIILPALILSACNYPITVKAYEPSAEELAITIVARTSEAEAARATEPPPAPAEVQLPQTTTVSVSTATNCRTGPDINYSLVLTLQPGAIAEVVGKYSAANYWIINTPTGGTCWLWGAYASILGDPSILPEIAAPPPPVAAAPPPAEPPGGDSGEGDEGDSDESDGDGLTLINPNLINPGVLVVLLPPAQPASFSATANCQYFSFMGNKTLIGKTDKLTWSSVSNATGYKVYVNGIPMKDVGSGTTSTTFDAMMISASNYGIAAYNAQGSSSIKTIPDPNCP